MLKYTIRNIAKRPFLNLIKVIGLSLVLGCVLLIVLFLKNELSYDRYHESAERIYRFTVTNSDFLEGKHFAIWIIISFILAVPLAYFAMNKWLENFAYRIEMSWWIFALAGISAMIMAVVTISLQSWKTASRNPVEALRYE